MYASSVLHSALCVVVVTYYFVLVSGADYMVPSKVEEYQTSIRRKLGQRLEYCGGNAVVLFDELQKAAPGTLDGIQTHTRSCSHSHSPSPLTLRLVLRRVKGRGRDRETRNNFFLSDAIAKTSAS